MPRRTGPPRADLIRDGGEDCTCPYRWGNYGYLYGTSMGEGWIRERDDPNCPHHGPGAK